jgi:hypothetical protein
MSKKRIKTKVKNADQDRVEGYLRMLDRILLYNMAVNTMPPEILQGIVKLWDKVVLKSIDIDASLRTAYMEGTKLGRVSKLQKEPDGEDLRLHCLDQWKLAKSVVESNLLNPTIVDEDADLFGKNDEDSDEPTS